MLVVGLGLAAMCVQHKKPWTALYRSVWARFWGLLFSAMLVTGPALAAGTLSLATPYDSNNTNKGVMFDIDVTNTVTLTGLDANLIGSGTFELYYRIGGYAGHENNPGDWTLLATSASVTSLGLDQPTPVPMSLAVVLSAGTRYGFYLTNNDNVVTGAVRYTNGTNAALASDANLTVYSGIGKHYPFSTNYANRRFNGTIHYALGIESVADLSITKTDGVTTVNPGGVVTYTITASNVGPSDAPGTVVADALPAALTSATWTCVGAGGGTCTASGSGSINDTVSLPAGASVTYTLSAVVSASANGTLSNTATVTAAGGVVDPTPGNNSATDGDSITPRADLSIAKTDGVMTVNPGGGVTYTITASNAGPSDAPGTVVADALPAALTSATWTCVGAGGGTCTASGSGSINDTVSLPAGASVSYTLSAVVSASASGTLSNTATVTTAGGVVDPAPGNNSATDSDAIAPATCLLSNIPTLVSGVTATLSATGCSAVDSATFVQPPPGAPTNTTFPYGLLDFSLSGSASTATVTVTYSQNLPSGATFYKVNGAAYSSYPASVAVNSVTFTLTDNDAWDGNSAPGVIRDPSGLGFASSPTSIPTLSEWGTILLSCLMAVAVFVAMRRRST